jgi:Cu(I)/Ag(I) efflux system protein CusF
MKLTHWSIVMLAMTFSAGLGWAEVVQGMAAQAEPMQDMRMASNAAAKTHHAVGTVKRVDSVKGSVTISHGPVTTLNWSAMTMTFGVKDRSLLDKLAPGNKVEVDFVEDGANYTIVNVK